MKGPGCKKCPVNEWDCDAQYRGSRCAELRAKAVTDKDPATNADRIRAMSDEELKDFLFGLRKTGGCPPSNPDTCVHDCEDCWNDWLQQPVEAHDA